MSECWYIHDDIENRCGEKRLSPNEPCSYETLSNLMIFYMTHEIVDVIDNVEFFAEAMVKEMGYYAYDVITISEDIMGDSFDALAEKHFSEHAHADDEIRFIIDGEGYFDIRDPDNRWIRMFCKTGDCIILPAGSFHRFTTTFSNYIMAVRLFKKNPRWIALNRYDGTATEPHMQYLASLQKPRLTTLGPSCDDPKTPDCTKIYSIPFPQELDEKMEHIARRFVETNGESLVMYCTGTASPYVGNESWCIDCISAKPSVIEGFNKLCDRFGRKKLVFVEVPVERSSYLRNPDYPLRRHKVIKLQSIPTLFVFVPNTMRSLKTTSWWELLMLKVRTESPTPDEIINW
ncbi:unnamed protein product [Phytomonas sp. Hart1]|nr:unnamed protein product [Phytomonas sp. Hart1]|eukprot:CCW66413.1 unnamed protein product [Phytomonas sp. isolate Hart1]